MSALRINEMKKKIYLLSFVGLSLLSLTGCPFDSEIALGDSYNSRIDTILLGSWIGTRIDSDIDTIEFEIIKFNEHEYLVEYGEYDAKDEVVHLRAFTTVIDDIKIVNINEIGRKVEYTYYKYRIESNKLIVAFASDEFIKTEFNSPEELSDFFKKNIGKKKFFEQEITFYKK